MESNIIKEIRRQLSFDLLSSFGWAELEASVQDNILEYVMTGNVDAMCRPVSHVDKDGPVYIFSDEVRARLKTLGILEKAEDYRRQYLYETYNPRYCFEVERIEASRQDEEYLKEALVGCFGVVQVEAQVTKNAVAYIESGNLAILHQNVYYSAENECGKHFSGNEIFRRLEKQGVLSYILKQRLLYQYCFEK